MKKQIQLLAILLISTLTINGQSIKTLRKEIHDKYTLRYGEPVKIVETIKDYTKSGIVSKEEIIDFSKNGKSITTSRYDNGVLEMNNTRVYNENKLKTSDILKRRIGDKGWVTLKTTYNYDQKGTFKIITKMNADYSKVYTSSSAIVQCDSLGEFTDYLLKSDNALALHETGVYDYANNFWTYSIYDPKGHLKRQEKLAINPSNKYNDKGDVIFYAQDSRENNKIFYRVDYTYDESGNWVEKNVYQLRKDGDKAQTEKLFRSIHRKIEYKKMIL